MKTLPHPSKLSLFSKRIFLLSKFQRKLQRRINPQSLKSRYLPPTSEYVLSSDKTIDLCAYSLLSNKKKMVFESYLLGFPFNRFQEHLHIESASRLIAQPSREETRQVLVMNLGEPVKEIHFGIFGTFNLYEYYPKPTKCVKCQCSDHKHAVGVCTCRAPPHQCLHQETQGKETHHIKMPK